METSNHVQKGWRTREQKEEIIRQWQQSGKSMNEFCQELGITYNSLVGWCKQFKDKKAASGFTEVKIKSQSSLLFAQVHLPGGVKIDLYQRVAADYFQSFIGK